jgi:hypothetical protein
MEHLEARRSRTLADGGLPIEQALRYATRLPPRSKAHRAGIVHRDLKAPI